MLSAFNLLKKVTLIVEITFVVNNRDVHDDIMYNLRLFQATKV